MLLLLGLLSGACLLMGRCDGVNFLEQSREQRALMMMEQEHAIEKGKTFQISPEEEAGNQITNINILSVVYVCVCRT